MNTQNRWLIALLALAGQGPAVGQDAAGQAGVANEIIVSVRKQDESLQEVPISVSVVSDAQITRFGINSLADVTRLTPGVILDQGFSPQDTRIVIRGLSPTRGRPNAAVLQDGIDISSEAITTGGGSLLINPRLVDLARVEVVRGPQSALYGRSAFAGAINYVTAEPAEELARKVTLQLGSNGRYQATGSLSGPITDTFRAGLNGAAWTEDGFYRNALSGDRVGGTEGGGFAGSAVWLPTDNFKLRARVEHTRDEFDPPDQATVIPTTTLPVPAEALGTVISPAVTSVLVPQGVAPDGRSITLRQSEDPRTGRDYEGTDREITRASLIAAWELTDASTVTSWTHVARGETTQALDGQRKRSITSPAPPESDTNNYAEINIGQTTDLLSQELRYSYDARGNVSWSAGALYWSERADVDDFSLSCFVLPSLTCEPFVAALGTTEPANVRAWSRDTTHWSAYGLVQLKLAEDLVRVTLEARYVNEDLDVVGPDSATIIDPAGLLGGPPVTVPPPANPVADSVDDSYVVPKITVELRPVDDLMVYASVGEGVKPRGISTVTGGAAGFAPVEYRFERETMWAYELGAKTTWLDGSLTANAALFYQDYKDKQGSRQVQLPNGTIGVGPVNAGSASVQGLELELNWQPADGLLLNLGYTYLDTEYDDFTQVTRSASNIARAGNCTRTLPDGSPVLENGLPACLVNLAGRELEGAPQHSLVSGASYTGDLTDDLRWQAGALFSYQDRRFQADFNDLFFDSYWLLDLNFGVLAPSWDVTAYVENVADDDTVKSGIVAPDFDSFNFVAAPPPSSFVITNMGFYSLPRPRTAGIRASFRF